MYLSPSAARWNGKCTAHVERTTSIVLTLSNVHVTPLFQSHSYRLSLGAYDGCLAWHNVLITSEPHEFTSVKSQFPKVRQKYTAAADSCDGGISVLNHCLSWSKFVNTHLSHSRQWFEIHLATYSDQLVYFRHTQHRRPLQNTCILMSWTPGRSLLLIVVTFCSRLV